MVSNLPLLFARGSPTSLESMCLEELQGFLRFVLKCEHNISVVDLDSIAMPPWWPGESTSWSEGMFRRKEGRGKASATLRAAIRACYAYHDCLYLLEFCRKLITFTGGKENLQVVDNRDGTRSLLNKVSKKLLVTFKAENQDYDKLQYPPKAVSSESSRNSNPSQGRQQLVNSKSDNTSDPSLTRCVDVYLCDTCDKDFEKLSDLLQHEKVCGKVEPVCSDEERNQQEIFLGNVKLVKNGKEPIQSKVKETERPRAANYDKFMEIDVGSPLGHYIINVGGLTIDQTNPASRGFKSMEEYNADVEARCPGTIKMLRSSNANMEIKNKWNNCYRASKKKANLWTHTYPFTAAEMELKVRILRDGLTPRALRMYRKCSIRRAKATIMRLPDDTVREYEARYKEMTRLDNIETKSRPIRDPIEDKLINELLCENSLDGDISEKSASTPINDIVSFENVGFRTSFEGSGEQLSETAAPGLASSSFVVHDEAYSSSSSAEGGPAAIVKTEPGPARTFQVPRPLPELQRLGRDKEQQKVEVECVDLCSSDED